MIRWLPEEFRIELGETVHRCEIIYTRWDAEEPEDEKAFRAHIDVRSDLLLEEGARDRFEKKVIAGLLDSLSRGDRIELDLSEDPEFPWRVRS